MTEAVADQEKQRNAKLQNHETVKDEQAEEKANEAFESGLFISIMSNYISFSSFSVCTYGGFSKISLNKNARIDFIYAL